MTQMQPAKNKYIFATAVKDSLQVKFLKSFFSNSFLTIDFPFPDAQAK